MDRNVTAVSRLPYPTVRRDVVVTRRQEDLWFVPRVVRRRVLVMHGGSGRGVTLS